jgi:hypothetical protein
MVDAAPEGSPISGPIWLQLSGRNVSEAGTTPGNQNLG